MRKNIVNSKVWVFLVKTDKVAGSSDRSKYTDDVLNMTRTIGLHKAKTDEVRKNNVSAACPVGYGDL